MSEYKRTTRECTLNRMNPELAQAIRNHIDKYVVDEDIEETVLIGFETISTREKRRFLRRQTEVIHLGGLITPKWLIWAVGQEGEPIAVLKAKLNDIQMQDYETTSSYKLIPDSGMDILDFPTADGRGTAFIGLGPEAVSNRIKETLRQAIMNA